MIRRLVAGGGAVLLLVGCVGSTDRAAFEEETRARGGGISGAQIESMIVQAAEEVAVTDPATLEILSLRIDANGRTGTIQARRGDRPDFVDLVAFRSDEVISVQPMQDADPAEVAEDAFGVTDVALGDAELLVDAAIVAFGDPDTLVSDFSVRRRGDLGILIEVGLESTRRTGEVLFDGAGNLLDDGSQT